MSEQEREYLYRIMLAYCTRDFKERMRLLVIAELFKPQPILKGVFTS